ncbi:hypothetical protein BRN13_07050, partial [Xanthomonas oryzae pv. oryzae]
MRPPLRMWHPVLHPHHLSGRPLAHSAQALHPCHRRCRNERYEPLQSHDHGRDPARWPMATQRCRYRQLPRRQPGHR